jgi:hypothetical protein
MNPQKLQGVHEFFILFYSVGKRLAAALPTLGNGTLGARNPGKGCHIRMIPVAMAMALSTRFMVASVSEP